MAALVRTSSASRSTLPTAEVSFVGNNSIDDNVLGIPPSVLTGLHIGLRAPVKEIRTVAYTAFKLIDLATESGENIRKYFHLMKSGVILAYCAYRQSELLRREQTDIPDEMKGQFGELAKTLAEIEGCCKHNPKFRFLKKGYKSKFDILTRQLDNSMIIFKKKTTMDLDEILRGYIIEEELALRTAAPQEEIRSLSVPQLQVVPSRSSSPPSTASETPPTPAPSSLRTAAPQEEIRSLSVPQLQLQVVPSRSSSPPSTASEAPPTPASSSSSFSSTSQEWYKPGEGLNFYGNKDLRVSVNSHNVQGVRKSSKVKHPGPRSPSFRHS